VLFLRSLIFNVVFYLAIVVYCLILLPTLVLPRGVIAAGVRSWVRFNFWLMRVVCKQRVAVIGRENVPHGSFIVASKHQSVWETFALVALFPDPVMIAKRELFWIPLFGWSLKKFGSIGVDRTAGTRALASMLKDADEAVANGRQIVIFPEGTRKAPGAAPDYKPGVNFLYAHLKVPCVPVALNSGVFWPRRKFLRYPGVFRVEVLHPIAPGLKRKPFRERLQNDIETATANLVAIGLRERDGVTAKPPASEQRPAQ
jgi:1-acyl-sn-glycerol-3-phosphate acyltransferase